MVRRTSAFSRVVAFITAMAMAMLVVTVAHREVISAETGEDLVQTVSADEAVQLYSDIMTFEDDGTSTSVDVNATDCIAVQKSEIYLNGSALKPETNIGDNQELKLELEWYIPADKDADYSGKTFVWDITDELHGITLENQTYKVRENGKVIATYEIRSDGNSTIMYITPLQGFDGNHFNKHGSITLNGKTSVDKAAGDNEGDKPYLGFFDKNVNVTIPEADVYTQKSAGALRKGSDGKYYQEFIVTVVNRGDQTADENKTVLVDKPGEAFIIKDKDGNINVNVTDTYSGWNVNDKIDKAKITSTDEGFKISVGSLSGKGMVTVKYELEVDLESIMNSSDVEGALATLASNEVYLENPDNPDASQNKYPSTAVPDITKYEPSINKYGTYDYDNDTITWVITVSPNEYYSDKDFEVNDKIIIDALYKEHEFVTPLPEGVIPNGNTIVIPKSAFTKSGDNWVYTYTTSVPANDNKDFGNKQFKNEATLTLNEKTYPTISSTVVKKGDRFMTKKFQGLNGNILTWEVNITVPQNATYIDIRDRMSGSTYAGNNGTYSMFRYSSVSLSGIDADGGSKVVQHQMDYDIEEAWNQKVDDPDFWAIYPGSEDMNIQIKDQAFLSANAGKKIRLRYGIELVDGYDIDLLSWFKNSVKCDITDGSTPPPSNTAEAEYKSDVAVTKTYNEYDLNSWGPILVKNDDGSADIDSINELNSMERNNKTWQIFVTFPKGLELGDKITFYDHMEGDHADSYRYSGQVITDTDENGQLISKDVMAVGYCSYQWGQMSDFVEIKHGDGENDNHINLIPPKTEDMNLTLTVQINDEETLDALNDGKYLVFMYHTVMTDEAYTYLNSKDKDETWTITNVVDVNVNGGKKYTAEQDLELSSTNRIFDKTHRPDTTANGLDVGAWYTLEINKDSLQLGATNATIRVEDHVGLNLRVVEEDDELNKDKGENEKYKVSVTSDVEGAADEVSYTYNDEQKLLVFTGFRNGTHYTIKYYAVVTKFIGNSEEISEAEMQKRYGNEATITYDGSNGKDISISDSVCLKNVKSSSSIASQTAGLRLNFTKDWKGNGPKPESITVLIKGVAKDITTDKVNADIPPVIAHVFLEPDNNGSWVGVTKSSDVLSSYEFIADDDKTYYYEYTVEEMNIQPNYTVDYGGKQTIAAATSASVPQNGILDVDIPITNTYNEPDAEKIDITVTKIWKHGTSPNQKGDREAIKIKLYRDDDTDNPIDSVTLNGGDEDDKWTYTFTELEKDDGKGHDYVYTVKESGIPANYKSEVSPKDGISGAGGTFTVTNTYDDPDATEVSINVVKKWEGDDLPNLADGNPKDSRGTVTVVIYQDDNNGNKKEISRVSLNAEDNKTADNVWTSETIKLPKFDANKNAYTYTLEEVDVGDKYVIASITDIGTSTDKTFTVTNVYQPEKINVSVTKKWVDDGNPNADEIDKNNRSATVQVYRGVSANECREKVGDALVLTGDDDIKTLENLDKYDSTGRLYIYKVVETSQHEGYTPSVKPSSISGGDDTFTVTNTYKNSEESSSLSESESSESESVTPSQSESESVTPSQSESESVTPSQSESESVTPSQSESESVTPSQSESESVTPSQSESESVTPSQSESESVTLSQSEPEPVIPSESGTPTPSEPGTSNTPYDPGTPYIPTDPIVPEKPPYPFFPVTSVVTTAPVTEPVVTTPVHEEVIEDEEIEYEDVSSAAEIFDDTEEAVKRDNILIIILVAIIIIGNSILFYRSKTVDADRKYRM